MADPGLFFGEWVRQRRRIRNLTQVELARCVDCAAVTIIKIENGERRPSRKLAVRLARCLGIPAHSQLAFIEFARAEPNLEAQILTPPVLQPAEPVPTSPPAGSGAARRYRLPVSATCLIGREQDLAAACNYLSPGPSAIAGQEADTGRPGGQARLLTIFGTGGIGKTRLALQMAADLAGRFEDGACFVGLASITDPELVASSILGALGLADEGLQPAAERLLSYLQGRHLLLLLDNFEQVISAAPLLAELLRECPRLVFLVTSREILRVPGEHVYPLRPLPLPDPSIRAHPEAIGRYPGIALFLERAQAASPGFALTEGNATGVAQVCRALDGIPLAIELAAARVRVLSPAEIAGRLADRLGLLGGTRAAGVVPRHETLRASLDWSYALLSEPEQYLFRRLAVFSGGFTLQAAEMVAGPANPAPVGFPPVLDLLTQLADKSLVYLESWGDESAETRYAMLETVRQYANEKLEEVGEAARAHECHAACFVQLAELAEPQLRGPNQVEWIGRLEREQENMWAAAMWSRTCEPGGESALRLTGALAWLWRMLRGNPSEWRRRCEQLLADSQDHGLAPVRARALLGLGTVALLQGDYPSARAMAEESLGVWRSIGDSGNLAHAFALLGLVNHAQGLNAEARSLYEESLVIRRALGDRWGMAQALNNLATLAEEQGEISAGYRQYAESLALARATGDRRLIGLVLVGLASATAKQGDCASAHSLYAECLVIATETGDKWLAPQSLTGLAELAAAVQGEEAVALPFLARAARLCAAAEALREAIGSSMWPSHRKEYEARLAMLASRLGRDAFLAEWAQGRAMSLADAATYVASVQAPPFAPEPAAAAVDSPRVASISPPGRRAAWARLSGLTQREREVAALVAQGTTNREIAETLVVSERTVATHVGNILSKLEFSSRTQIAVWAIANGLAG